MADGKLIFLHTASGSGKLVLGDQHASSATPDARFGIDAEFDEGAPRLVWRAVTGLALDVEFDGDFAGVVSLEWDANAFRNTVARARTAFQQGVAAGSVARPHWQRSQALSTGHRPVFQQGLPLVAAARPRWQRSIALRAAARPAFQQGVGLLHAARGGFQQALSLRAGARVAFEQGLHLLQGPRMGFEQTISLRAGARSHFQAGAPLASAVRGVFDTGWPVWALHRPHFQVARRPPPGRTPPYVPPVVPTEVCYDPARLGLLVFDGPIGDAHLVFVCERAGAVQPPATVIVLPRRSTIVVNSIEIRRADSVELLPSEAFAMTLDRDSWTWSFSATLARSARDAVAPAADGSPVELEVKVNGQPFRLQAERLGRSVRFPERLVKVSGRGKAALLDAPHAAVQSFGNASDRSAQQLMIDVLTINGVGIGWTVDFGLTDWFVPGGAWLHRGTWISALNEIAGAAGGYLQPHDTAATLRVLPGWPVPWWDWASATPDLELPAGIAEVEETEWIDKPLYDHIFVVGEAGGVHGDYKRVGTSGLVERPMVVHPLITDEAVVRQRAVAELSDSGRLINQTLTLPVLPETGVIKPGTLLRYTDDDGTPRLGLVRSTGINWSFPVLTQTIGIEGHA